MSVVYPADCARLPEELRQLRRAMLADMALLVGGRAAGSYAPCLRELGVVLIHDVPGLCAQLDRLRQLTPKA